MGRAEVMSAGISPLNLYIRKMDITATGILETGKEFGLGRDRRIAITEAIQANIELFSGHKHKPPDSENQQ